MKTPVAFFIFNRPDVTRRVFDCIAAARPERLLVVGDGPRPTHPDDEGRVLATRAVIAGVDWPCEVVADFAAANMGCRRRISSGLSWVFSQVEEAVILEDDCLPDPSFFPYCEELLERYRDVPRVMHIAGANLMKRPLRVRESYVFSRYAYIWGWATWRRAWARYDAPMAGLDEGGDGEVLRNVLTSEEEREYWRQHLRLAKTGVIDTWDYAWLYSCWKADGLAIVPGVNLVTNIGFGATSTHTPDLANRLARLPVQAMELPLRHPVRVAIDDRMRDVDFQQVFRTPLTLRQRWWRWQARRRAARIRGPVTSVDG